MKLLKNQTDFFFMSGHIKVDILCSFSGSYFYFWLLIDKADML